MTKRTPRPIPEDQLARIQEELKRDGAPSASQVAEGSGIPYDTVLRLRNGEGDPGYSKVLTLARYLAATGPDMQARSRTRLRKIKAVKKAAPRRAKLAGRKIARGPGRASI